MCVRGNIFRKVTTAISFLLLCAVGYEFKIYIRIHLGFSCWGGSLLGGGGGGGGEGVSCYMHTHKKCL